jgi:Txe/YoeB family toxin of Txe-Axe toxin-antitoxin module
MQKTLEIYLKEQREKIAEQILASYEPQKNDNSGLWARAIEHCAKVVLSETDTVETSNTVEIDLPVDTEMFSNVIKLPTRTRPSDTRE